MNAYGTVLLVGGALYSAFLLWRKAILPNRLAGNVLIAAGGLLPALGGALILPGRPEYKYLGQLLGSVLLFAGFLMATARRRRPRTRLRTRRGTSSTPACLAIETKQN
jgi:hypothetical protein